MLLSYQTLFTHNMTRSVLKILIMTTLLEKKVLYRTQGFLTLWQKGEMP